ncbi:MAG: response regulator transcription factor [Inconstantimicrobium porci]|uniref:response regulator transcription factor n=1 Tax=Inconstantimicrobium porci TaxID=2652291 RepID=UPI00240A2CE5|nr:response regulator transcription factor [Inconstantimicrobium porci]MDD6770955.1 response regulator transcription factor [Inconstantimicrobium porci]MDY5912317.1 response regulator transcription factor [Inconstantimicrobium porci]
MKETILIAEDEIRIRILLRDYLLRENYNVVEAKDGEEAVNLFSSNNITLAILDVMMPKMDGFEVAEFIRSKTSTPIIMLTAKSEEEDKLHGYDLGIDDYVTKPFSPKVLIAKIKALLKRTVTEKDSALIDLNGLTVNKLSHEVKVYDDVINLSPKEFELLLYLIENKGIALTRDKILDNVWGMDYFGDIRTVDTNIKRLREKLKDKANYIATIRGSGYKLEVK